MATQRARKACIECRLKKYKCNGEDPCSRCAKRNLRCEYTEYENPLTTMKTSIDRLEARFSLLERNVARIIGHQGTAHAAEAEDPEGRGLSNLDQGFTMGVFDSRSTLERRQSTVSADSSFSREMSMQSALACAKSSSLQDTKEQAKYADGFGALDSDNHGILRYVGLGSSAAIVDRCNGLRRHVFESLKSKGYEEGEPFLATPRSFEIAATILKLQDKLKECLLPELVLDVLLSTFIKQLLPLFPIISEERIKNLTVEDPFNISSNISSMAVLLSIYTAAVPLANSIVSQSTDKPKLVPDNGAQLYEVATLYAEAAAKSRLHGFSGSQDVISALALLAFYLGSIGSQAEAWLTVGSAIRFAQDIGLHRSPAKLRLPSQEQDSRRYIWWCLYILDTQLGTALGRPLSIDDADCDVELPTVQNDDDITTTGFISLIHLHKITKVILKTVGSINNANSWWDSEKYEELHDAIKQHDSELQNWAIEHFPNSIKAAQTTAGLIQRHIAFSCYFSTMMLLYRSFMPQPHKRCPLQENLVVSTCAETATNCIRNSTGVLKYVPQSHYLVLHGQNVFVSAIILLQCIRGSYDNCFISDSLKEVEVAIGHLRDMESLWRGAKKARGVVEEYFEITLLMQNGYYKKGVCNFSHESCEQPELCRISSESGQKRHEHLQPNEPLSFASESKRARIRDQDKHDFGATTKTLHSTDASPKAQSVESISNAVTSLHPAKESLKTVFSELNESNEFVELDELLWSSFVVNNNPNFIFELQ